MTSGIVLIQMKAVLASVNINSSVVRSARADSEQNTAAAGKYEYSTMRCSTARS